MLYIASYSECCQPSEVQQSNINRFGSYTEAMFDTEDCTLVTTAYSVSFVKNAEALASSGIKNIEQGAKQKHRILCEKNIYPNAAIKILKLSQYFFLFRNLFCLLQNINQ